MGIIEKEFSRVFFGLDRRHWFDWIPDEMYLKIKFRLCTGYPLNLKKPQTYNEKLQWLKLHCRRPEFTNYVDKYMVRSFIKSRIGEEYLIPSLGVWDTAEDVDFEVLPDKFVLKCNHNSGKGMCICKDKALIDKEAVRKGLRQGLKENYFIQNREWPYKNVPRKIVGEQFMEDGTGHDLMDYKVLCFDGEPKLIELHKGRFSGKHTQDFYDTNWRLQNITQCGEPSSDEIEPKPALLGKMLALCRVLAEGIPHVRVDWYIINNRLYFGEMTFFDGSGFDPFVNIEDDKLLGSWINL